MTRCLLMALLAATPVSDVWADQPAQGGKTDACLVLNNRILGPRGPDRLLPLSRGDPTLGFHSACALPWSKLSPANQPLPVTDCYQGGLQFVSEAACGRQTGPLWINSRWVVTSAELQDTQSHAAICQQLETGTWAGTRDLQLDCVPRKKELNLEPAPRKKELHLEPAAPAQASKHSTSAAGPVATAEPTAPAVPSATTAPVATPAHR
jgi:hypothetical protein